MNLRPQVEPGNCLWASEEPDFCQERTVRVQLCKPLVSSDLSSLLDVSQHGQRKGLLFTSPLRCFEARGSEPAPENFTRWQEHGMGLRVMHTQLGHIRTAVMI